MKTLPLWFKVLLGAALAVGIFLRLTNLNVKIFWIDEVSTAWSVSGYTENDVAHALASRGVLRPSDIVRYQREASPGTWLATVHVLASSDPAHPPLYYLLVRGWRERLGNSVTVTRLLSAIISLMGIVCIYILCVQLFASPLAGLIAAALLAVSPYFLYYAQEAREYALLTMLTLLSSVVLLRGERRPRSFVWLWYAATLVAGLYTSLLFLAVVVVHAGYAIAQFVRFRSASFVCATLFSVAAALVAVAPWVWNVAVQWREVVAGLSWLTSRPSFLAYISQALAQVGGLFVWVPWPVRYLDLISLALFALIVYSLILLFRRAPTGGWIFVALLVAVPTLPLLAFDVIGGGSRLLNGRYLEAAFVGIDLSVAYMFANHLRGATTDARHVRMWLVACTVLLLTGGASCVAESRYPVAWGSMRNAYVTQFAPMLNRSLTPLLVSDVYRRNILDISVLSHSLEPHVALTILQDVDMLKVSDYGPIFALDPSPRLLQKLRGRFRVHHIAVGFPIFELELLKAKTFSHLPRE